MELDYHYYVVYKLAKLAGLSPADAETVAYASQYVDDSTESEPIVPFKNQQFDTVRTAHYNLGAFDWDVQKKIYMPFHFLPSRVRWNDPGRFSYVTAPASTKMDDLSASLVKLALDETDHQLKLIRVGVALHTVADTFSHFGFSGRHHDENDVGNIWISERGGQWDLKFFLSHADIFVPRIGHVEAFGYPDLPYQVWKYEDCTNKSIERNNTEYCLEGASLIYKYLKQLTDGTGQQADLGNEHPVDYGQMKDLFSQPGTKDQRCRRWKDYTKAPKYDKLKWRKKALKGSIDWDDMSQGARKYRMRELRGKKGFDSTSWAHFHRAAHIQRSQVLAWLN